MNTLSCVTTNIMANKRAGIILHLLCSSLIVFMLTMMVTPSIAATAEDTKPEAKSGTSLEEERLKILKADLQAQIEQLKKLKQELEVMQKGFEGKRQEQLTKVVKMYEAMAAEDAAKALDKLDDDTAVQILSSLKARSAGKIMGQLDPARAAALSKKVLARGKVLPEKSSP
ncbi:MAG: MotE family protein [Dissulfurispiraceae bacterium]|jgi:flagellar motility protein MotE (MotC chaperone)